MLLSLLVNPHIPATVSYLELNSDDYEVTEIQHRIGRASTVRFRPRTDLGDTDALAPRTCVRFTYGGTVWFAGRTLPVTRKFSDSEDYTEYTAADILEWMSSNPCEERNEWYNRVYSDSNIFPYPFDYTLRQIIEAELQAITGTGKLIGSLDWTGVPSVVQNLVIQNFHTKGRTFLGLLDALAVEVPTFSYWYDPTTVTQSNGEGGVLRFYDISTAPSSKIETAIEKRGGGSGYTVNVLELELSLDISKCVDTLTVYGWGDMIETYEEVERGWDRLNIGPLTIVETKKILRDSPTRPGRVEQFSSGATGGSWTLINDESYGTAWYPQSRYGDSRWAFRRYKTSKEIVDLKLTKDAAFSPARWIKADRSMWVHVIPYGWKAGKIFYRGPDGDFYSGLLSNGIKTIAFSNGFVDDWGSVSVDENYCPNYPSPPIGTIEIGTPDQFERNYFTLATPLAHKTAYNFSKLVTGVADVEDWSNLLGSLCYLWWYHGSVTGSHTDVFLQYTGKDELFVELSDSSLGYDKHARLWDQRFLRYTTIEGVVIRDDTTMLTAYATMLFSLMSRTRVYGTMEVIVNPSTVFTDYPMGGAIRVRNYGSGYYDVPSPIQGFTLTKTSTQNTLSISFDTPDTFTSLDHSTRFRQFFYSNEISGTSGALGNDGRGGPDTGGDNGGNNNENPGGSGGGGSDGGGGGFFDCCATQTEADDASSSSSSSSVPP